MDDMRIGMIGTGRIAQRFLWECREVPYAKLVAIYNPHEESAERFVREHGQNDIGAYAELDPFLEVVDAVYIATPHQTHADYVRLALQSGKHVLCEKPMCLEGEQAVELYELAREHNLVLMEAVKTAYCPGFEGILKLAESGKIGAIHDIEACFTRLGNATFREVWDTSCGGSFTELGTYPLLPIVKLFGTESKEAYMWSLPARTGVDSYTKVTFNYEHGIATAKTGLGIKSEGQLLISGSNGYILVPSPWWLTRRVEVHYEDCNKVEVYEYPFEGSGLRYEITSFIKKALALQEMQKKHADASKELLVTIWNYVMQIEGVTPEESIWMACQMENFRKHSMDMQKKIHKKNAANKKEKLPVKIWAHRGCCMQYPENTLIAFEAAAKLPGLTGIELDVQLSKDGELVVIHDEKLDRTTTGSGSVRDYTLEEIKAFAITGSGRSEEYRDASGKEIRIPSLREVFELLEPYCRKTGLLINIELKNSVIRYEGMEQKVIDLVEEYDLKPYIVYSSFLHESMGLVKSLDAEAKTGILAVNVHDCISGSIQYSADALHPCIRGLDINRDLQQDIGNSSKPVRAWNGDEPFYGQDRLLKETELTKYQVFGVTDIITNVPENYLQR